MNENYNLVLFAKFKDNIDQNFQIICDEKMIENIPTESDRKYLLDNFNSIYNQELNNCFETISSHLKLSDNLKILNGLKSNLDGIEEKWRPELNNCENNLRSHYMFALNMKKVKLLDSINESDKQLELIAKKLEKEREVFHVYQDKMIDLREKLKSHHISIDEQLEKKKLC